MDPGLGAGGGSCKRLRDPHSLAMSYFVATFTHLLGGVCRLAMRLRIFSDFASDKELKLPRGPLSPGSPVFPAEMRGSAQREGSSLLSLPLFGD